MTNSNFDEATVGEVNADRKAALEVRNTGTDAAVGVWGKCDSGVGTQGNSKSSTGVWGMSDTAIGVLGESFATERGVGVWGICDKGVGTQGNSKFKTGVWGHSAAEIGVFGDSNAAEKGVGVLGKCDKGVGTQGNSITATGVWGVSEEWIGVQGDSTSNAGVMGRSKTNVGILGVAPTAGRFEGNVEVTGDIKLLNQDCAEDFDVADSELNYVEAGTVMVLNEKGSLQPSYQEYDKKVAGVISGASGYKPAIVLGRQESQNNHHHRVPVALIGKVYCKVDARNSSIEIGDLLTTSSTKGYAMKADDSMKAFGAVLGKALASIKDGIGMIPVLVALQ